MSTKILISVVGPTAIGKTRLALSLAQYYGTVILSADSRQFYKEMKIGTAVPSPEELTVAKHHFIQHKSIFDTYSVGDFERDAVKKLKNLFKEKDIVIMVGGSGLYVDAVANGLDEFPKVDPCIRTGLSQKLENEGIGKLQLLLKELDPKYYDIVDVNNPHRLIRALEICIGSGEPYSSFLNQKKGSRAFRTVYIGIHAEREIIYDRINRRVDLMIKNGLLEEAERLFPHKAMNALQTVGYKEVFDFITGKFSLDEAIEEIKKNTRRFAKRQLTWYRKKANIFWVDYDEEHQEIMNRFNKHLKSLINE